MAGTTAVLIDDRLVALDRAVMPSTASTTIVGIGPMDSEPVYADLANPGLGRKPLAPVHARCVTRSDGALMLDWVRRARGAWAWLDGVDAPLVEEKEAYRVGFGPVDAPIAEWSTDAPHLELAGPTIAALSSAHPGEPLWVRQIGRFAQSAPLLLTRLT